MEQRRSVSSNSLPGTPIPRLPIPSLYSMRSTRSMSAPPDFRVNDHMERLIQAFQYYYTAHPITLSIENSPVVMIDLHQNLQDFPKRIIAPDGFIPNSVVRTMLTPVTPPLPHSQTPPTDLASQRLNLEQLVKRYLSDERTKDTLSSITFLKDVALLRIATSATGIERMRGEIMTNLAIEVEGLLEQPCEQILEEDHVEEDEAARMEKTAKLHKFARQITKQTVQRHFEQKVQETLERRVVVQKDEGDDEEEEPFVDEEEQQQEQSTARSGRTPINWRQEEDLIDQLGKNEDEEIQRRMQVERERVLPYDFVRNTLDKMATEWGGMARVMATIHGAIKKKQQQLDQLDSILKSRECRVGMLNSVVSPPWIFLYLSIMLGSSRTLMEFLESLLDPETSADVLNGLRMQLMGYVGPAQRLDQFLQEFGGVKQILEEVLVNRGMPKDAAKSLVYEALCDNPDARSRISQWISMPDPEEAIQAVKICNREKVQALAKALSATKHLDLLPTGTEDGLERAKESADASLLAQLDVDVKRVMQYDGREVEEPEEASSVDRVGTQLRVQLAKPKKIEPKKPKATIFSSPSSSDLSGSMVESPEDMKQSTPTKKALKAAKKEPEPKVGRESEPKEEEIVDHYKQPAADRKPTRKIQGEGPAQRMDTYDDFTRAAGAAELESSSRQLQSRTRTVPVSTAKRVKRMPQKTKPKEEEEDDEQGTEAPETTGSFEDKPLGEEEEEGEEDEEEEGLSELLDDELLELDLAAVENELMAMAEESDDILRELDEEEESSPMPTFLKSGEVTSTTEGTYPDPAFQRGAVKRFTANFGHPDDPVREEKIKVSTDTPEEYMNSLSKVTWFTSKGPHAKKEAVVVDIVRSFPQIAKLEDLRAAEIALVLFKRQYGIRSSCVQYVLKVMNKLFFKFLNLIKLARKSKQGSRNEAFVRALATLTVANNYEEDIIEKLDMLKDEYRQVPTETTRKPRKSRVDKKRMSKESIREGVGILGKLMHTPGEKHEGMSPKEIEELLQAAGEEEQEVSPEDQELIRQKRRDEVANKLRMKAQEKQAMLRQMTKRADQKISRESEEPQSAQSLSEGHGEEDEEGEGEEGRKTSSYDYIRRKKKALQDQETESSSSKESGLHKIEEEISLAAMEAKRRRMKKEKESGEQPRTPTGVARSPVGEQSLSPLPPTQKQLQLQKLQQKMRLGLPGTTSKALKQLMDESGEEQLPEYEEAEERPELYGSEESEVEELEEVDEEWVVVSAKQRKQARRKARKGKVPRAARKEKRSIETKSVETRPTETGMLIRFPVTQRSIPRDTAASILKEFLDSQILTEGKITTPSISLRALATALQDPNKSEKAQQLLQAFEQALGLDEKDPTEVMEEIKFRLDAPPTSKMDPFNKMVNMLSIVMAMDSETAEQVKFDFGKVTEAIIQQADVVRQRKEILSSMVDDIASQLKYEYAIMNDLAPGQRSVWMALDTQADTMRECCEKIGYLVSANAMTSELASFIVSVFTMDLLDFESMLKQDTQLTESEQRVIYRQAKDIQEVLSWFNVKPSEVTQTLEEFSYLMDHEPIMDKPRKKKYQLDVIFPSSYLNRAGNELLAEFTTVQFVDDEPRAPLEEIYKGQPAKKRTPRKEEKETGPSRSILKLMTQRLSEIKKAFEDPLREQESALSRLGAKLVDGWKHLTEAVTAEGKLKEEEEFEGEQEMVAFETGRIPITARTASGAAESKWQRKGGVKRPQPTESPSDRVVVAPMLGEDLAKHLSPVKHTATPKELATARPPYDNVIALHPGTKKAPSKRARDVSSSPAPFAAVANLMGPGASIKLPGIATTPIERAKRGRTQEPLLTHSPIDIRQQKMDTHVRSAILAMTGVSIKKKTKTRGAKRDISIQTLSSPTSSSRAASVEGTASVQSTGKKPEVAERREPPFRFASSTGTPLSSVGALPEIISTESLRREVSPDKVQTHTLEMVSEQVDRMSYEAQRLSELEEITPKATGVWTWLDTLLAPQTKSSALLQSPYQTSASEQKFGALRRLHRASGTRLISRFEEKGEHLQYLVRNLEDTDMLVTPSDQEPAPIQVKYMKETEDEQTKISRSKYLSGSLFTAIAPGAQRAELIRKRLVEKGMFSPLAGRTGRGETERVSRHTSKDSVGINRFATDLDFATKYLQTVIPPGRLTLLLNEIQGDETSPDALTALEEALILAANKADAAEHEEWMHTRGSPRPSGVPPGQWRLLGMSKELNKLQTDNFHQIFKGVHCRHALLVQKGFHKQGLSIAAHLARMELVECINKSIQQRAYRRIQTSMRECLKKVIQ